MIDLKILQGCIIERVIAGGSNGSIILFDIKNNISKYVFFIYCSWQLTSEIDILNTSEDDPDFFDELKKIKDDVIININIDSLDRILIQFDSGKKLEVFCDITKNDDKGKEQENWSFCDITHNICYNYTNNFIFTTETYS